MKNKKVGLIVLTLLVSLLLSGCGTKLYEMTDDEKGLIVQYAAYVLAKHNSFQKDGMVALAVPQDTEQGGNDSEQTNDGDREPETQGTEASEDRNPNENPAGNPNGNQGQTPNDLAEVLGVSGQCHIEYKDAYISGHYQEGRLLSIEAPAGFKLLVMNFEVKNGTDTAQDVDLLTKKVKYKANFDGKVWISNDDTVLLYDLSTYKGTIEAGGSVDVVLLFTIPSSMEGNIKNASLKMMKDDKEWLIFEQQLMTRTAIGGTVTVTFHG